MTRRAGVGLLLLLLAAPAAGVLVDTPNPELYEKRPRDDPGWRNVGRLGFTSAIYLGKGWMLTARHASLGPVELDGQTYALVDNSMHWLSSPSGGLKADLMLFRIAPEPDLPALSLRRRPVRSGEPAIVIGYGQGRGGPARSGPGFRMDGRGAKRWGANRIEGVGIPVRGPNQALTLCFSLAFDADGPPHEAQATIGDSGGAVFVRGPKRWQLAGVMLAIAGRPNQPSDESLYGNLTHAADLAAYAPEILAVLEGRYAPPPPPPAPDAAPPAHELP